MCLVVFFKYLNFSSSVLRCDIGQYCSTDQSGWLHLPSVTAAHLVLALNWSVRKQVALVLNLWCWSVWRSLSCWWTVEGQWMFAVTAPVVPNTRCFSQTSGNDSCQYAFPRKCSFSGQLRWTFIVAEDNKSQWRRRGGGGGGQWRSSVAPGTQTDLFSTN